MIEIRGVKQRNWTYTGECFQFVMWSLRLVVEIHLGP